MVVPDSPTRSVALRLFVVALILVAGMTNTQCTRKSNVDKRNSRFLNELKKERYHEAKPPSTAPILRWDFSRKTVHNYLYEQEAKNKFTVGLGVGEQVPDTEQSLSAKATLLVKSQGDGTAELVLKDSKVTMKMTMGKEKEPKIMESTMPPIVVQDMKEDGSASFGNSSQDLFLRMLFPLPRKPLNVGEFVDADVQMPFNAMGSLLQVKGRSRMTLTRYVEISGRICAQFDVDTDISGLRVSSELEGDYKVSMKGRSLYFFDIDRRLFVYGSAAALIEIIADAPMPKMNIQGEKQLAIPKRVKMSMASDTVIKVFLDERKD